MSLQVIREEKKYVNMFLKLFLRLEIFLILLDSIHLFGSSFQNAAFREEYFTNQTDSLRAHFAKITFTGVGGRGKREIREICFLYQPSGVISFLFWMFDSMS